MRKAYFPLYTSDYLRDTRHLSTKAHGAYLLLLLHLWDCDGEMKESAKVIQRVTGLTEGEFRTVWHKDLKPFFILENGMIRHKRVTHELKVRAETLQKRRKSGAKGGKKTQEKQRAPKAIAQAAKPIGLASPLQGERPSLSVHEENSGKAASPPSPLMGGGDAPESIQFPHLRKFLQDRVEGLMKSYVLSAIDVRHLKDALRGGSEERLLLASDYQMPPHVANALKAIAIDYETIPKLKLVTGD